MSVSGLTTKVMAEVSGFGVRPIHVGRQEKSWIATFKLPPGLTPGWHQVRVRVQGTRLSEAVKIAVDLPLATEAIHVTSIADGATWKPDEIDLRHGTTLALWIKGLPESADRMSLRAAIDRRAAEISYVEPAGEHESRQVNLVVPQRGSGEATVEVGMGTASVECRVRVIAH